MSPKRSFDDLEPDRGINKRKKSGETAPVVSKQQNDPKNNPYLAHMYGSDDEEDGGVGLNGFESTSNGRATYRGSRSGKPTSSLGHFQRHKTTVAQVSKAEDGPENPFTGASLSQKYFNILKTRRNLPVHAQR